MFKFKERLINLNISFSKEIVRFVIITVVLFVVFLLMAIFLKFYPLLIIYAIVMVVFAYLYFTRYKSIEKKQKSDDVMEFVDLFAFFRIYLKNGFGVYSALKEISMFANFSLRGKLEQLLSEIDEDKSITPFMNFAHHFNELIVEEMMVSIYQMIEDGTDANHLIQFEIIFNKLSDSLYEEKLNSKDKSLSMITATALVGSAYLIITITIGVVTLLGDMINGL